MLDEVVRKPWWQLLTVTANIEEGSFESRTVFTANVVAHTTRDPKDMKTKIKY